MKIRSKKLIISKEKVPVYDLSMNPENPCFSLKSGIISHNTVPAMSNIRDIQRSIFDNGILIHFDYSQAEVRVMAALAKDEQLLQAFGEGKDIHRFVASKVWDKSEEDVTDSERRFAKQATFSTLYGKTVESFAEQFMAGSLQRAQEFFDRFFSTFPSIKEYIERMHSQVKKNGEVVGLWGDTIIIEFDSEWQSSINAALRYSQNYPIQQAASNISGVSLSRVVRWLQQQNFKSRMYGFTHDSGELDSPAKETLKLCKELPRIAEKMVIDEWNIPATIDIELGISGNTYIELKKLENQKELITENNGIYQLDCKFEGSQIALEGVCNRFKNVGAKIDYEVTGEEEEFTSYSEYFTVGRAYSESIGKKKKKKKGNLSITL